MKAKLTKNAVILFGLLLLGFVFFWLSDSPQKILGVDIGSTKKNDKTKTAPFAVANNAATRHFNEQGHLDYQFVAEKLEHYKVENEDETVENFTLVYAPNITIFQEGKPWLIEARNGKLLANGVTIELWGEVIIKQPGADGSVTQLLTEKLEFHPKKKTANTQETVTILSPRGTLTGHGMIADFSARKVKLLSKVRGIHEPI